jgi:hypothetical protein
MTNNNKDIPYINRRSVAFVIPSRWKESGEGGEKKIKTERTTKQKRIRWEWVKW